MKKKTPPSLRSLARSLGESPSSVSRALRGHSMPEAKRQRILKAAEKAGYDVNPVVSNVMRRFRGARDRTFSGTIAYLTGHHSETEWQRHAVYTAFHEGARTCAERLGFQLDTIWAMQPGLEGGRLNRVLAARGIKGVIFAPWPAPPPPDLLDWNRFALVQIGIRRTGLGINRVTAHLAKNMELILRNLHRLGYRQPGYVTRHDPHAFDIIHGCLAAYAFYQTKLSTRCRVPALELEPNADDADAQALFTMWFERHKPDVVIGFPSAMRWLRAYGQKIPEQTGFVDIDSASKSIQCAGINQNAHLIGAAAVDMVVNDIFFGVSGFPEAARQVLIVGKWVDGPTLCSKPSFIPAESVS